MQVKKFLAMALVCIMIVGTMLFAACTRVEDNPEEIVIMIQNAGYHYRWLDEVGKAYTQKTGTKVTVNDTAINDRIAQSLVSPQNNPTDIYFGIRTQYYSYLAQGKDAVSGYDCVFVDLSEVYSAKAEGYGVDKTIGDMLYPYAREVNTYWKDNKPYFIAWVTAVNGIVYNKDLYEQYLEGDVPNTTDELLEDCQQIKDLRLTKNDNPVYAFTYAQDYFKTLMGTWFAQYVGSDAYEKFVQGQDENGEYTPDIYRSAGMYSAMQIVEQIVDADNAYANPNCTSYNFTQSQMKFLEGESFMNPNGDWLERETENDFEPGELNIAFMKTPINSQIVRTLEDKNMSDETLSSIIDEIDRNPDATSSDKCSDSDFARLKEARNMVPTQSQLHSAFIPSYSNNIDGAKDFLKYLYSRAAQEIMMKYAYGNTAPINYDFSQTETYKEITPFAKSKYELLSENTLFIGQDASNPMAYLGGAAWFEVNEKTMATVKSSASYKSAYTIMMENYDSYVLRWNQMMAQAGVSN